MTIVRKPGTGKTALLVRATQIARGEVPAPSDAAVMGIRAAHFCQVPQVQASIGAVDVLGHPARQLAVTLPRYADEWDAGPKSPITVYVHQGSIRLSGSVVVGYQSAGAVRDPRLKFERSIQRPLTALPEAGRLPSSVVVMVDGLDGPDGT